MNFFRFKKKKEDDKLAIRNIEKIKLRNSTEKGLEPSMAILETAVFPFKLPQEIFKEEINCL
jgi:hypothetical protein